MDEAEGGYFIEASSYLIGWYGPVLEEYDVYDEVGKLSPYLTSVDYDIIHVHMTSGMSAFRKSFYINAGKRAGKKVVVSLHCCEYFSEEWARRSSFYQKRVREALQKGNGKGNA